MSTEKDFVDDLMNKVFNFKAPEMPDFSQSAEDQEIIELDFEELEYLNAAGKLEIQTAQSFRDAAENNQKTKF